MITGDKCVPAKRSTFYSRCAPCGKIDSVEWGMKRPDFSTAFQNVPVAGRNEKAMYEPLRKAINALCPQYVCEISSEAPDPNDPTLQKVDLALFRKGEEPKDGRPAWPRQAMNIEVKLDDKQDDPFDDFGPIFQTNAERRAKIRVQLASYADMLFNYQHRAFCFTVVIFGKYARIIRWDRSGAIVTEKLNWKDHPEHLGEFFWRFDMMTREEQGYDTTVTEVTKEERHKMLMAKIKRVHPALAYVQRWFSKSLETSFPWSRVRVDMESIDDDPVTDPNRPRYRDFLVGKPHFATDGIIGRCTRGFVALDAETKEFVWLKDAWRVDLPNIEQEGDILSQLHGAQVENIPTLVCHGDVLGQSTLAFKIWKELYADKESAVPPPPPPPAAEGQESEKETMGDHTAAIVHESDPKAEDVIAEDAPAEAEVALAQDALTGAEAAPAHKAPAGAEAASAQEARAEAEVTPAQEAEVEAALAPEAHAEATSHDTTKEGKSSREAPETPPNSEDAAVLDMRLKPHTHYRLVTKEVCLPLDDFEDGRELLRVVLDCVIAHEQAYTRLSLLHRDISIGNLLILVRIGPDGKVERKGILVDWELAKKVATDGQLGQLARQPDRTGTWQFLSAMSLRNSRKPIILQDDLESFFHVTLFEGACWLPSNCADVAQFLYEFFDASTVDRTVNEAIGGRLKFGTMQSGRLEFNDRPFRFLRYPGDEGSVLDLALNTWLLDSLRLFNAYYKVIEYDVRHMFAPGVSKEQMDQWAQEGSRSKRDNEATAARRKRQEELRRKAAELAMAEHREVADELNDHAEFKASLEWCLTSTELVWPPRNKLSTCQRPDYYDPSHEMSHVVSSSAIAEPGKHVSAPPAADTEPKLRSLDEYLVSETHGIPSIGSSTGSLKRRYEESLIDETKQSESHTEDPDSPSRHAREVLVKRRRGTPSSGGMAPQAKL